MKTLLYIFLFLLARSTHAFMLYDISWDNPPHEIGSAPSTDSSGASPDRPTSVQQVTTRDNISGMDGPAAVLEGYENSFIGFFPNQTFTSGVHRISWWAAMLTMDPNTSVIAQTVAGQTGNPVACSFINGGDITLNQNTIGTWALGEIYKFETLLNLDSDTYDFFFNGNQVITGQALEPNANISQFGFQRPYGSSEFAVDNIQWEVIPGIPEPGTISLLMLGLPSLCFLRGRLQSHNQ